MLPISAYFASETKYINRSMERYMGNKRNLRRANLKDEEIQKYVTYNDGELALVKNIHDINSIHPCQLEVFVIVLVLEGKASVNINGTRYEALPNALYIGTPNNIVENGMTSLDFKSYSICVKKTRSAPCNPRKPGHSANTSTCCAPRRSSPPPPKRK